MRLCVCRWTSNIHPYISRQTTKTNKKKTHGKTQIDWGHINTPSIYAYH